ncbi:NAD-dependent succinate-semialdehyde dehydrogenase [Marinobacter sp. TBZ242]|uniref:NAD-dependent succinate-semialdehyde dehydrogenase n=1 Tax=Marinobacter azerbaijanicus TaxID=3050455 RepID=A0ABT7IKG4_9GAMM|nr:NAD-dependent succinate-semialdehyde dehydrogenase [Marinobacter sp. TBZ242]MDL0433574.1 NAD-dependent succinate-semialdehyde dehydrogenase [Marinobacter sp. TBZ242]
MKAYIEEIGQSIPNGLFINGEWITETSGKIEVVNPATEKVVAIVPSCTSEHAKLALDACEGAAKEWMALTPRERSEVLRSVFDTMQKEKDTIARLITLEEGKTLKESTGEVDYASEFFRWYGEESLRLGGEMRPSPSGKHTIVVTHQPVGTALLITPWNFPAAMITRKIAPAIAAGCGVIVKPPKETPLTSMYLADLMQRCGVPDGLVNILTTDDAGALTDTLVKDARLRKISFTGSTGVGRLLLGSAAERILNTSMELGGNAPLIVCDDADIDTAIEGAFLAKMRNAGESCIAANRLYVHDSIYDEFCSRLVERFSNLKVGNGLEADVDVGPIISRKELEKLQAIIAEAVSDGATVETGGTTLHEEGFFFAPTVLSNVKSDSRILDQEVFGPIAPLVRFRDVESVIQQANDTPYGLAAYVFSRDVGKAMRIAQRINAGIVGVNRGFVSDPAAPFGGMKESGIGREGAQDGIKEFLETQYIATSW